MSEAYKIDPSIKKLVNKKDNTIALEHLTSIKMGCKRCIVIHEGMVKEWIGIGWVDKHKAKGMDFQKYPKAVEN